MTMRSFSDAARDALATTARKIADRLQAHLPTARAGGIRPYRQPFRLIAGMPKAKEPCLLPMKFDLAVMMRNPFYQWKVDGLRALYIDTSIVSREAIPMDCALHCLPALFDLEQAYGEPMVFDGEYQALGGFQATLAEHRKGEGTGTFWIFDAVPLREWQANKFTQPLRDRMAKLEHLVEQLAEKHFIATLALWPLTDIDKALAGATTNRRGFIDGIVVKDSDSLYERGRSRVWMKVKQEYTVDAKITDVMLKGDDAGGHFISALMVGWTENGRPRTDKVGSFSAEAAEELHKRFADLKNRCSTTVVAAELLHGSIVEIQFNDKTDRGKLRGAYMLRFRDDKKETSDA